MVDSGANGRGCGMRAVFKVIAAALAAWTIAAPALAQTVLHRGNGAEPGSLDPHKITGQWESNIVCDMLLGLMTEDAGGKAIYGAATSYEISPDGLVWTWRLREGATWSDGVPVTAHDFVFALRRINDPATAAQYASLTNVLKNATAVQRGELPPAELGVRAIDDLTLEMTLAHPAPYLPDLVTHPTFMPVPRHAVEAHGNAWTAPGAYVSNGPYVLKDWRANDAVELLRNPAFLDAASVAIERVIYYASDDAAANVRRFRAGELDMTTPVPGDQIETLRESFPDEVRLAPFLFSQYVSFNMSKPPFDNARVRRALSLAIDREAIVDRILKRGERPAYALVPDVLEGYGHEPQLDFRPRSRSERLAEAKALLAEAGYGPANPLRFQLNHNQTVDHRRLAPALQAMWAEIGADATLQAFESAVLRDKARAGDFQAGIGGWIADYQDAKNYLFLFETRSGEMNTTRYRNAEFDALVLRSDQEADPAKRQALLAEAERLLLADQPIAPLVFGVSSALVRTYVAGRVDNPGNVHRTRWLRIEGERTPLE